MTNSFIYQNRELLNALLKIGQEAGVPLEDPNQIKAIALKFVNNLIQQQTTDQTQFVAEKAGAELNTKHLTSLSTLLNFLESNGISISGIRLVLPSSHGNGMDPGVSGDAAFAQLDKNTQAMYVSFPKDDNNFQYYVFKAGLLKYLSELQSKANSNEPGSPILRPFVEKLNSEAEAQLGISVPKEIVKEILINKEISTNKETNQKGQSSSNISYQQGQTQQVQQLQQNMAKITSVPYPFAADVLNFAAIDRWLSMFISVFSSSFTNTQTDQLQVGLQVSNMAKSIVTQIMNNFGMRQQSLSASSTDICRDIKSKAAVRGLATDQAMVMPRQYLDAVAVLIQYLQQTLLEFKDFYQTNLPQDYQEIKKIDEQVSDLLLHTNNVVSQWINDPVLGKC